MTPMMAFSIMLCAAALWLPSLRPRGRIRSREQNPHRVRRRRHPWWARDGPRQASRSSRSRRPDPALLLTCAADIDLFAACVSAGLSSAAAASTVAASARPATAEQWATVSALLELGMPPEKAWSPVVGLPGLGDLAGLSTSSHRSGAALADGCERIAERLRAETEEHATAAAERAGVFIAMPLALCFLPAFILVGLAPVIVSLARDLF